MMSDLSISQKVIVILCDQLGVVPTECTPTAKLGDDLGLDDIDWIDISIELEDVFDAIFDPIDLEDLTTVQQLIDHVTTEVE